MIGKTYAGELHVRGDEGGQDFYLWITLNVHKTGNGRTCQGLA
jgi:hypothetical protein